MIFFININVSVDVNNVIHFVVIRWWPARCCGNILNYFNEILVIWYVNIWNNYFWKYIRIKCQHHKQNGILHECMLACWSGFLIYIVACWGEPFPMHLNDEVAYLHIERNKSTMLIILRKFQTFLAKEIKKIEG